MKDGWVVMESKSFTIPSLPPSKNQLHSIMRITGRPLLFNRSKAYEKWRQETLPYIPMIKPLSESHYFKIDAVFYYPFLHKNGKHRRLDCHNFLEALCDTIANKNGFDDSFIKFTSSEAYDYEDERLEVVLSQVKYKTGE